MQIQTSRSVWEIARELAKAIEETDELAEYRATEDAVLTDQEALDLIRDYEAAKRAVKKSKTAPPEAQMLLVTRFMEIEERFNAHSTIQAYWDARTRLDAFLDRINAVVTFPLTGQEEPKGKGGSCGSGGGGCGCG
ncbi:MAG TPA: YlbF family regulator [Symbiobacteriaceae bacterium]|nr:YlbF family regulator [Symbiobacteriaceae bacterium]